MIRSKLHILEEWVDPDTGITGGTHPLLADMRMAANYVVENDVLELLKRSDVQQSIAALCDAKLARLPMPSMVIEMEVHPYLHELILLREFEDESIAAYYCALVRDEDGQNPRGMVVNRHCVFSKTDDGRFDLTLPDSGLVHRDVVRVMGGAVVIALQVAVLMLNTLGIEKEVVKVDALNKARSKKGRKTVVPHTLVRIGRIYQKDGSSVRHEKGTGRSMPMHIRQAHTRRQRYGTGRQLEKLIFVPMCIVNYKEDEPVPQVKKRVTA